MPGLPQEIEQDIKDLDEGIFANDLAEKIANTGEATAGEEENTLSGTLDLGSNPDEPAPVKLESEPAKVDPTLEQRFSVLEGKYNAEVPRLSAENRTLNSQVQGLQNENFDLRKQLEDKPAPEPSDKTAEDLIASIDPEAIAGYGEEFVTMLKLIKNATDTANKAQVTAGEAKKGHQDTTHSSYINNLRMTVEADIKAAGGEHVNFDVLNDSPGFNAYLSEMIPGTNYARKGLLTDAHTKKDLASVTEIFRGFINLPKASLETEPEQQIDNNPPLKDLNDISPSPERSAPNAQEVSKGKGRIYTQAFVNQFTKDYTRGKYVGTVEEAKSDSINADIFTAMDQGRIQG